MNPQIKVGDSVRLISLPDWVIHDLPADEQRDIRACVGQDFVITEIDSHGYYWIGLGTTVDQDDGAYCNGHSFCVPRESLALISPT